MKFLCTCVLATALLLQGCREAASRQPETRVVRIVTVLGRLTTPLAEALSKVLPDHFPVRLEVQKTATTKDYIRLLVQGQAELAIVQTDLSYVAYMQGLPDLPGPQQRLRGIAVLYRSPLHLIARRGMGVETLSDLRGKRVFVGTDGNTTELSTKMILEAVGISVDEKRMPEDKVPEALSAGELDAAFIRGNDPSPAVQRVMKAPGVFLVPIRRSEVEKIRTHHPFLRSTSTPARMYGNDAELETVGTDMLLACRDDLPEELVYWVTRTLFESLPDLAASYSLLRQVDLQQLSASPIPLHPGAARFYRERELFQ
jgi:TRAP transporter TAXI family solute receptor